MVPYSGHCCQEDPGVGDHQNGLTQLIPIRAQFQERLPPCRPGGHCQTAGTGRPNVV
jgi:hypothetical protein